MSAEDRRELVVAGAVRAFAVGGYHGTSTDAVARAAGVSQPYVVRIFGTKLDLFLEVFDHVTERVDAAFTAVIDQGVDGRPFDPDDDEHWGRLGLAYADLLADRDVLMVMMHGFSAGGVPEIAGRSRTCMSRIFATLAATGADEDRITDFVAHGMLLNVMVAMRAPEHVDADPPLARLAACAFGEDLPQLTAGAPEA
jgi:AcrR family transcriptional regulator